MKADYKEGDLVIIVRQANFTLCKVKNTHPARLRECAVKELEVPLHPPDHHYKDIFENIEGNMGIIVYVARNRLEQPLGYRVLIKGEEMFCTSKVAQHYFKLVENPGDESR